MSTGECGIGFDPVLDHELTEIGAVRKLKEPEDASVPSAVGTTRDRAQAAKLIGLAFSGGGIRSATFNLGILQAMARRGCLNGVDYLSTVSGGGYIGSWLAIWIKRQGLAAVTKCLSQPGGSEFGGDPIEFLRNYSNYLTPELGVFSADTWTMIMIWVRNTILNQAVLVSFLALVLLLPRMVERLTAWMGTWGLDAQFGTATLLLVIAVGVICSNLCGFTCEERKEKKKGRRTDNFWGGIGGVQIGILLPMLLSGWTGSAALFYLVKDLPANGRGDPAKLGFLIPMVQGMVGNFTQDDLVSGCVVAGGVICLLLLTVGVGGGYVSCLRSHHRRGGFPAFLAIVVISLPCAALGAVLLYEVGQLFRAWIRMPDDQSLWHLTAWGGPLVLYCLGLVIVLHIGLLGKGMADDRREWWSRVGALLFLWAVSCNFLFLVSVYGPLFVKLAAQWLAGALTAGWLATAAVSVFSGFSPRTGPMTDSSQKTSKWLNFLAMLGPPVYIIGLLVTVAYLQNGVIAWLAGADSKESYWRAMNAPSLWLLLGCLFVAGLVTAVLGWRVDVNEFSMHRFYRNRLVRCYLGASHAIRVYNPLTGFDNKDDLSVGRLRSEDPGEPGELRAGYEGPFPIINTALNFNHGVRLAWQERKAASFTFTPLYSGYAAFESHQDLPKDFDKGAYRLTPRYGYVRKGKACPSSGPSMGTAMAISGAAVSPSMGYHTSGAVAFLLTMFNVRLGWWLANPAWHGASSWYGGPRWGFGYLLKELMGSTTVTTRFVYLSDGGHFENLGIYELVRRRCRLIIACDAEEDPKFGFGGLGNAIRKCRDDFAVNIDIDTKAIRTRTNGRSQSHFAVGRVLYPDGPPGTIVYIKSSLAQDAEPTDVLEYSQRETGFPHQSTGDQFFDESQFESYRALGQHIGMIVFPQLPSGSTPSATRSGLIQHFG